MSKRILPFIFSLLGLSSTAFGQSDRVPGRAEMQRVYEEVKTPYKYGVILKGADGDPLDCPSIFRYRDHKWYMVYICMNKKGYETHLAKSEDLLNWKPLGKILPFSREGSWDAYQAAGYIALQDPTWGGSAGLEKYKGRYWMSYLGGSGCRYQRT